MEALHGHALSRLHWELSVLSRAVAYQNLSSAAMHIGTSQPQLSRIISKLERELKTVLLDRTSRRKSGWTLAALRLAELYMKSERRLEHDIKGLLMGEAQTQQVKIPAGVKTGSKIRLAGMGQPGWNGAEKGDLYLVVEVLPDERFELRGDDLYTEFELPLYTAMLGGTASILTLDGSVNLNIPAETQNGRRFRLRGKGMPKLKSPSESGDLYATANVHLPERLSDEERQHFEALRALRS